MNDVLPFSSMKNYLQLLNSFIFWSTSIPGKWLLLQLWPHHTKQVHVLFFIAYSSNMVAQIEKLEMSKHWKLVIHRNRLQKKLTSYQNCESIYINTQIIHIFKKLLKSIKLLPVKAQKPIWFILWQSPLLICGHVLLVSIALITMKEVAIDRYLQVWYWSQILKLSDGVNDMINK